MKVPIMAGMKISGGLAAPMAKAHSHHEVGMIVMPGGVQHQEHDLGIAGGLFLGFDILQLLSWL